MDTIKMKDLPENDRPYEKCLRTGPEGLSDAELLSVVIRTGSRRDSSVALAEKILALNYPDDGILGLLHLSLQDLQEVHGIGKVKAIQLSCVGELSKRIWKREAVRKILFFDEPNTIVNYFMEDMRHMEQEQLHVMFLNTKNVLIRDMLMSKGTVNASVTSPREIFIQALKHHAVSVIMVHNHPSGDPSPSQEDIRLTRQVREAGELIGIQLLDHIIIGDNSYCSFRREGML